LVQVPVRVPIVDGVPDKVYVIVAVCPDVNVCEVGDTLTTFTPLTTPLKTKSEVANAMVAEEKELLVIVTV
jgi:hypothetical protein